MIELEVEKLIWRGRGLGRLKNGKKAIILPPVLPKEKICGEIVAEKKDYVEVIPTYILKPSPYRVSHPCKLSSECGGCRFGFIEDNHEIDIKREIFYNEFSRATHGIFKIKREDIKFFPSKKVWGYRWRGQVFMSKGRPHFKVLKGNRLVPFDRCLLFAPPLNEGLKEIAKKVSNKKVVVCASPLNHKVFSELDPGPLVLPYYSYNFNLEIRPGVFFQANWELNQKLVDFVVEATKGFENIADLYAGCGNFAIPIAVSDTKKKILAIEDHPFGVEAISNYCKNRGINIEVKKIDLFKKSIFSFLKRRNIQCIIVDPPRSGGGKFIKEINNCDSIQKIIWISCDIVNSARDIIKLVAGEKCSTASKWNISQVAMFDMFPKTYHMEVVFILQKP